MKLSLVAHALVRAASTLMSTHGLTRCIVLSGVVLGAATCTQAAELRVEVEYLRTAPDGEIVPADRAAAGILHLPRVHRLWRQRAWDTFPCN